MSEVRNLIKNSEFFTKGVKTILNYIKMDF